MARGEKFDPGLVERLNDPARFETLNPDLIWDKLAPLPPQSDAGPDCSVRIVDLGAGTGMFACAFVSRLRQQGCLYACDVSDEMIGFMESSISEAHRKCVLPLRNEEASLPLESESIDLVYSINVYHELRDAPRLLTDVLRVLKRSGKLAVIDWRADESEPGPPEDHRVSGSTIEREVTDVGFTCVRWMDGLPHHQFLIARKPPC